MSTIHNTREGSFTIRHDIINFSTAQSKYSFGKDQRFKTLKPNTPTDFNVQLPSTFGRRSPSFGIGERFKGLVTKHKRKSTIWAS